MAISRKKEPLNQKLRDFDKFNFWAKQRFFEVQRTYPNLVWDTPQNSAKSIVWSNLHGSMKVICRQTSNCKKIREVYLDGLRRTEWDWEE